MSMVSFVSFSHISNYFYMEGNYVDNKEIIKQAQRRLRYFFYALRLRVLLCLFFRLYAFRNRSRPFDDVTLHMQSYL